MFQPIPREIVSFDIQVGEAHAQPTPIPDDEKSNGEENNVMPFTIIEEKKEENTP